MDDLIAKIQDRQDRKGGVKKYKTVLTADHSDLASQALHDLVPHSARSLPRKVVAIAIH
jgi:hypothetical protein